jgi:citrate lyase beta subunit
MLRKRMSHRCFPEAGKCGQGVIMARGRMVDRLQAEFARRTLALAEATPNGSVPAVEKVF